MGISPNLDGRLLEGSGATESHTCLGRAGSRFQCDEKQQKSIRQAGPGSWRILKQGEVVDK